MESQQETRFVFDIPLRKCFTAQQVLALWPRIDELELYRLVMRGRLRAYLVNKDRQFPNGDDGVQYLCADEGAPHLIEQNGEQSLCWDYVRFSVVTIVMFERECGVESLRPHGDFVEIEKQYTEYLAGLDKSKIALINESKLCASDPMCNFYDDDGTNNILSLFTRFEPFIDKFCVEDDESTFSVPYYELDEWKFQHHRRELRTWLMVEKYIERDETGNEKIVHVVIKVPKQIFYGKAPSAIVNDMLNAGYPEEVIAYALEHAPLRKMTGTKIGELLHEKKGLSQQRYMARAKELLAIAAKLPIQFTD